MKSENPSSTLTHDSFAAVANETRLTMLIALWLHGDASFTDLFDRTALEDTGQFGYHLNKLVGEFVYKRNDHYTLTNVGRELVMTIFTHVDGAKSLTRQIDLEHGCHSCAGDVLARSRGDWLRIDCTDCGKLYASYPVPRASLQHHDSDDMLSVFDQRLRRMNSLVHRDICPNCACSMACAVVTDAEPEPGLPFVFVHTCDHCLMKLFTVPATSLLEHPSVLAFYHDTGLDLFDIPHWELAWMFDGRTIDVLSTSPLAYTVTIEIDTDQLLVTLDETGKAQATERSD